MTDSLRVPLIDTHCHLQDPLFDNDRDDVLERARAAGVMAMVCVGYDLESSRRAVELAAEEASIYAAVGIHPNYAARAGQADWTEIVKLAGAPRVVGIGETGLDNYRQHTPPDVQQDWFERHLQLAAEMALPVIIHNRAADDQVREILDVWSDKRAIDMPGVMHCFSAGRTMLDAALGLGFAISFAGPVTFKSAGSLRQLSMLVPPDRLVLETDSPYLAPQARRGERNEPAHIEHTYRCVAEQRQEAFSELAESVCRVATALFGLSLALQSQAPAS